LGENIESRVLALCVIPYSSHFKFTYNAGQM